MKKRNDKQFSPQDLQLKIRLMQILLQTFQMNIKRNTQSCDNLL